MPSAMTSVPPLEIPMIMLIRPFPWSCSKVRPAADGHPTSHQRQLGLPGHAFGLGARVVFPQVKILDLARVFQRKIRDIKQGDGADTAFTSDQGIPKHI